ncbi:MAG: hypothetical protein WBN53_00465 [Thermodesulfobacteriota bacterium]
MIRYLDLAAHHYLNHPDSVKEFYFVLTTDAEKPPWVLSRPTLQRMIEVIMFKT